MTNLLRNAVIKFRKHDSNTQFETAPSTSPAEYIRELLNSLLPVDGVTKLGDDAEASYAKILIKSAGAVLMTGVAASIRERSGSDGTLRTG